MCIRDSLCAAHRQLLAGAPGEPREAATVVVAVLIPVAEAHGVAVEALDILKLEEAAKWFGQGQVGPHLSRLALSPRFLCRHCFLLRRRPSRASYTRRRM